MSGDTDRLTQIEANALVYLTDDLYEDGREHAGEITDSAAPDLLLARDVLALVEIAKAARAAKHELGHVTQTPAEAAAAALRILRTALSALDGDT